MAENLGSADLVEEVQTGSSKIVKVSSTCSNAISDLVHNVEAIFHFP